MIIKSTFDNRRRFVRSCASGLSLAVAISVSQAAWSSCEYVVSNHWGEGFVASIKVKNDGPGPINGWNVSWRYSGGNSVSAAWNAQVSGTNPYTAVGVDWNANIQPRQTVEFGFQGRSPGGTAEVPTVTGAACGGATTSSSSSFSSSSSSSSLSSAPSSVSSSSSSSDGSSSTTIEENSGGFCGVDGSIDSNHVGFTGSGFVNTTNAVGMGVNYSIAAEHAGYVTLSVRFASINNRPGNVVVNGNVAGRLNFVSTGAWTSWTTETVTVPVSAGNNTISIVGTTDGGLPNIDSLAVDGNGIAPAACVTNPGGLKNPPVRSLGCGKPASITTGKKTIMSSGRVREYIIDVPRNYDPNKPYRLFYASHGLGGAAEHVADWWNYFGLKIQAEAANEPAIFIAPQAINRWDESDHALFDNITDFAKANLCVDTTRVFVTGMSFGGMITYSLSTNHQKSFRAGVALAPANFNIWLPNPKLTDPIPWMQTTGMSDTTTPWDAGGGRGAKYIALEKARDNGCTVPNDIETWRPGDASRHKCVDLQGCRAGYPVRVCTFNGGHWQFPYDGGNGEDLQRSWVPVESWKFFTQF